MCEPNSMHHMLLKMKRASNLDVCYCELFGRVLLITVSMVVYPVCDIVILPPFIKPLRPTPTTAYHLLSSDSLSLVLAPPPNARPWDAKAKCSWIMVNVVCDLFYYPMACLSPCIAVSSRRYQFEKMPVAIP